MLAALLMVGVAAETQYRSREFCPVASCSTYLHSSTCGSLDYTGYTYLLQPCAHGYTCPAPNSMTTQDTLFCQAATDPYGFSFTSVKDLDLKYNHPELSANAVVVRTLGEVCGGEGLWCAKDKGSVCQCKEECRCVAAGKEGDRCSGEMAGEYPGCAWGFGCFKEYCEPWFSITRSEPVTDPWLCASMATFDNGSCIPAETSLWDISSPCSSNSDCRSPSGFTSVCTCGLLGQAYCTPFPLDEPYMKLKQAIAKGDLVQHAYWRMVVDNWAYLQREDGRGSWDDLPGCVGGVWPELLPYLQTLTYHGDQLLAQASTLVFAFSFLLASS